MYILRPLIFYTYIDYHKEEEMYSILKGNYHPFITMYEEVN